MFAAILSSRKISLRAPTCNLDADGVQLQFSPICFITIEHHVGFLRQINNLASQHCFKQTADICWGDLAFAGWE